MVATSSSIREPLATTAIQHGGPVHRGTRAHPTVCVDGLDQSVMGGPFLLESARRRPKCALVDLQHGIVDAEHDGYRRPGRPGGAPPVVHRFARMT